MQHDQVNNIWPSSIVYLWIEHKAWECCGDIPIQHMKKDVKECQKYKMKK